MDFRFHIHRFDEAPRLLNVGTSGEQRGFALPFTAGAGLTISDPGGLDALLPGV